MEQAATRSLARCPAVDAAPGSIRDGLESELTLTIADEQVADHDVLVVHGWVLAAWAVGSDGTSLPSLAAAANGARSRRPLDG